MAKIKFINLPPNDKSKPIYRIIPISRLLEFFGNNKNVLVNPIKWDDPFENFILKTSIKNSKGEIGSFNYHKHFYGQCWTFKKASDAIWRIYSPNSDAVRIRTTIEKLAYSLYDKLGPEAQANVFIGKVKYLTKSKLISFSKDIIKKLHSGDIDFFAQTLLVKRPAFRHEREMRILFYKFENNSSNDLFRYDCDPHLLIDQIMIDPRVKYNHFCKIRGEIKDKTGFKGSIKRSLLYTPPPGLIIPSDKSDREIIKQLQAKLRV